MPLIAGSLNFAWEINALLLSRGFYGHVLWTGLDVLIVVHNVRFLEKGKRKKYLLLIVVFILGQHRTIELSTKQKNVQPQKVRRIPKSACEANLN